MKSVITLADKKVSYTLRKSRRARRMRLAVYGDGSVVVTGPVSMVESRVESFIREKARWLLSKLALSKTLGAVRRFTKKDYATHKEEATLLVRRKIEQFNTIYGYDFNRVSVKDQKTCWGSCSRKRNLNFNYKIIFLPEALQDYVIVHELAHLKELNHSKKFWNVVAQAIPDHAARRKELKQHSLSHSSL